MSNLELAREICSADERLRGYITYLLRNTESGSKEFEDLSEDDFQKAYEFARMNSTIYEETKPFIYCVVLDTYDRRCLDRELRNKLEPIFGRA